MTLDVNAIEDKWLQQCGSCDAGLTMACSHPAEDYRPTMLALIAELRGLRSQLAESQQENEQLRQQLESRTRRPSAPSMRCDRITDHPRHRWMLGRQLRDCPGRSS